MRARRNGTLQGELFLLRRRRRQDLGPRSGGLGEAGTESDERSGGDPGARGLRGQLPEGSHHVRGRAQNHRQRGQIRGQGTHRTHSRSHALAPHRRGAGMKILVAVKQVAALDEDFAIRDDGRDVDPDFLIRDLNEWDDFSLEEAVKIKEASGVPVEVIAVSVGPEEVDESLRKCLAKGADRALRVWDEAVRGSDPIAVARILAAVARREAPDLLFAGVQSSDQAFASTGIATAGLLGWPHAAVVANLRYTPGAKTAMFRRYPEGGLLHEVEIQVPAVLTIQAGINTPRYASLRSIKQAAAKPIEVLGLTDLQLGSDAVGEAGSLSRVRRMYIPEKGTGFADCVAAELQIGQAQDFDRLGRRLFDAAQRCVARRVDTCLNGQYGRDLNFDFVQETALEFATKHRRLGSRRVT